MVESRRITGPHLLLDRPGAAVELGPEHDPEAVARDAATGAARLGWPVKVVVRRHRSGATVALEAPADLLYTACELLDWTVSDEPDAAWKRVEDELRREENPRLRALLELPNVFWDEDYGFTAGLGVHSRTWSDREALPDPADLDPVGIPFVLLTGTNGKTTTTRMLAKIASSGGRTPGWTCSDGFGVGDHVVESGDWTGPGAARAVLRHPEVDFACLETARGGLLRRGLVLAGADAAVVTNVSSDHLGEWGVHDEADMARAKLGVAVGLKPGGTLVVNAGNKWLRQAVPEVLDRRPDLVVAWFSGEPRHDLPLAAWADDQRMVLDGRSIALSEVPATFGGTARHNVENALAAALAARAAGLSVDAVAAGLKAFQPSVAESRGRMNRFTLPNGAIVLVDFAHNPDGVARVGRTTARWPAERRLVLLGQAGDRSDEDLARLAATVASLKPDVVVLKEMRKYLRGRPEGEVTARLRASLTEVGFRGQLLQEKNESEGVARMLRESRAGDLLLMLVQADLDDALDQLDRAGATPS